MRNICALLSLAFAMAALCGCQSNKSAEITAASYNIHLAPTPESNAWNVRKDKIAALACFHDFDVFGTQEGYFHQLDSIVSGSGGAYAYVAHGRDDGQKGGETSAILYKPEKFELLDSGCFWFAEDSSKPVLGWDAQCKRICSWARLKDKKSGKDFYFFCLHFDHIGKVARQKSAEMILKNVGEIAGEKPFIVVGDFNLPPSSEPMKTIMNNGLFVDSMSASKTAPYIGSTGTYHGYLGYSPKNNSERIDYVFVSKGIEVEKYGVLTDRIIPDPNAKGKVPSINEDGSRNTTADKISYPSDHFPVMVKLKF